MAYILLLDDNDLAGRALQSTVARGNHTCVVAKTTDDAWRLLREGTIFSLLVMEAKVGGQDALAFLQRVRSDWYWKNLPVTVYTSVAEPQTVRRALALKIQNYLIKPYSDQAVHAEIAKARLNPWRAPLFEEPKSFCAQLQLSLEDLSKKRRELMTALDDAAKTFPGWAEKRENRDVFARLDTLISDGESAGVWAGMDYLGDLKAQAERGNWAAFKGCADFLDYASRLIFCQQNPGYIPDCLRTEREVAEAREARERALWNAADVDRNGPVVAAPVVEKQAAALGACPVIDSAAAHFQMSADGRATSLNHLTELVSKDPGLSALVLMAANQQERDDLTVVDDPASAVSLLGEIKLSAMAKSVSLCHERHMHVAPLSWSSYWIFLNGVSRLSQFVCEYLEFNYLIGNAYTAGLLHDLGRLVLLKLYPFGFEAIVHYAQTRKILLHEAEKRYLGCTSREMGVKYVESTKLPPMYANVLRWVERPDLATEHHDLVAMVSLARHLCLHNHVGYCGDTPGDSCPPIETTLAWSVLQPRLFPSFDLKKFESQAHAFCVDLKHELLGKNQVRAVAQQAVA